MFDNIALDVFIGLVFIFLLYSLLATIVQEVIATRLAFRAKVLEKAILRMLEDGKTTTRLPYGDRINGFLHLIGLKNILKGKIVAPWFYAHPLIKYLAEDNYYSKPAYLDASNFSKVMIDLLKGFGQPESQTVQSIHNSITAGIIHTLPISISDTANPAIKILRTQNPSLQGSDALSLGTVPINTNTALFLRTLWQDSGADISVFKSKLEDWFNDTMERATGWYKKYTRIVLFIVGLIIAIAFNVDTIAIHKILSTNRDAREQLVQMAISNKDNLDPKKVLDSSNMQSDSLLNATYKMVSNDAAKANDILGLGRPWKDSCKTCDSLYNCSEKKAVFFAKKDSLEKEIIIITSLNKRLIDNQKAMVLNDSIIKNTKRTKTNAKQLDADIKLSDSIKNVINLISDSLSKYDPKGLTEELNVMNQLISRCLVIQNRKTFQYSPNQSGGFETILGWLITALAITLGAPFWFDLLSKLISLRGAGNKITPPNDDADNKTNAVTPANPVTVNVNSNPSEEAVG